MTRASSAISVVDVDLGDADPWGSALAPIAAKGKQLVAAFNSQGRAVTGAAAWVAIQRATGALHTLLGGQHGEEVDSIAAALDVPAREVVLANAAYDISHAGCSTIAAATPKGPLHARNLDWSFPRGLLKKNLIVARMTNGRRGHYALVTWPGMFGALSGIAPGRFSITVNFVKHAQHSGPLRVAARAIQGYWPVAWVIRRAFDEAKDFAAAVRLLEREYLMSPVLITIVGTKNDERVCIECGPDDFALQEPEGRRPLVVTNHYQSDAMEPHNVGLEDSDTEDRHRALRRLLCQKAVTPANALEALSDEDVLAEDTQHQVVMHARSGRLSIRIPDGLSLDLTV